MDQTVRPHTSLSQSSQDAVSFKSFFIAGFECASQRDVARASRYSSHWGRVDIIQETRHCLHARTDYEQAAEHGMRTVRDGLRWHLIERGQRKRDWSSFLPQLHAARDTGTQVIWDLSHYGTPDTDIWSPGFVRRFADFSRATAQVVKNEIPDAPLYCPLNEMSFWADMAGGSGHFWPGVTGKAPELKRQFARAWIAGVEAIRDVDPRARFVSSEPLLDAHALPGASAHDHERVREWRHNQYTATDMVLGLAERQLGGRSTNIDLIGCNYYPNWKWLHPDAPGDIGYRPLRDMLSDASARYAKPLVITETGAVGERRPEWLRYVCDEVRGAQSMGIAIQGLTLYPIQNHPAWNNPAHVHQHGLFRRGRDETGRMGVSEPLARELARQQKLFAQPAPLSDLLARPCSSISPGPG